QLTKPARDFKEGMKQAKEKRQKTDTERKAKHRQTIADRRQTLDKKRTPSRDTASHERPVTHDVNESLHLDGLKKQAVQQKQKSRPLKQQEYIKKPNLRKKELSQNKKEILVHVENPKQPIKNETRTLNKERPRQKNSRKIIKR